jgi:FkbM family methyltransferase
MSTTASSAKPVAATAPSIRPRRNLFIRKTQPLASRFATSVLRTAPRIFPIPGWFPVVVERLHPAVAGNLTDAEVVTHGVKMRLDLRDYIQRRIFYESHEPHQLVFCERFVRPGDVVLDVGAHVGVVTLIAASATGPSGEVHAFEPVPGNFRSLEANVRLNGFENVVLNRAAVGAEEGEISLGLPDVVPDSGSGSTSAMYTAGGEVRTVTAPVVSLDLYVEEHTGDRPIRLLKIDVEGLEQAVLEGFARRLASAPPSAILLEVNLDLLHRHGFRAEDLFSLLRDAGYRLLQPTAMGKLRESEPDFPPGFDPERDLPEHSPGPRGWLRRYREESRIFFNVFALHGAAR